MARKYTESILVTEKTKQDLDCLKRSPYEPYGEVVARLIRAAQRTIPRELETEVQDY